MKENLLIWLLPFFFAAQLRAQTHFPVRSSSATYTVETDTDSYEKLVGEWKPALNKVKQQVHANDTDFGVFTNFYQNYLDSERYVLANKIESGQINSSNIKAYINSQVKKMVALYANFSNVKNKYAGQALPPYTPPTCNVACTNMDFSDGNFTGWYGYYAINNSPTSNYSITGITGGALGASQRGAYDPLVGTYQMHLTSAANNDWFLNYYHGITMSQASPWGTGYSAMIGDSVNKGGIVAILSQKFEVTATTNSITYAYSILLENPNHSYYQQPFFSVTVFDQNGDTITNCGEYSVYSGPGLAGFKAEYYPVRRDTIYWRDWTEVNVPLTDYVGQCVTIQFEVSDCEPSGHCGYAYVDASCSEFAISPSSPKGVICGKHGYITLTGPAGEKAYSWSGPSGGIMGADTTQNINVDSLGKYTLIITPVTGALCKDTLTYTVHSKDSIGAISGVATPIVCYGSTGTALATESNGFGPFTYAWTPAGGSGAIGTGLTAGAYTVTVTDSNDCPATAVVTLTQPTQVITTTGFTAASCGNPNGTATVTATGGFSPYTYSWSPSAETTATATGLTAGSYTVTVTDKNHCTLTTTVTVTQPPVVTATVVSNTAVTCFGESNGSATLLAANGSSPYTYSWSPRGGSSATATGLTAGTYTVTVKDNSGCKVLVPVTITQPALLAANASVTQKIPCYGETGSATAMPTGGISPYTYLWALVGGTNATATNLSVGTYTVTVTDNNGCTASNNIAMTQPAVLESSCSSTGAYCNLPNGTAKVHVTGGTSPYSYLWTPSSETGVEATGLTIGTYSVNVTDYDNCTSSASVSITQPPTVVAHIASVTDISCFNGGNGTATATGSGGRPPYSYLWMPGHNSNATASGLFAVTYTVTVTDSNGCTASTSTTLSQPAQLEANISEPRIICKDSTGNLVANTRGGVAPYRYAWSSGITSTTNTATITPLYTQIYSVAVTDANGCTASTQMQLEYGPSISLQISGPTTVCTGDTVTLCVYSAGGTGGNMYTWSPTGSTNTCINVSPALSQAYTLSVTDNCGATASVTTTVYSSPAPVVNFSSDFTGGCSPFCVQFRNSSTISRGNISQYIWNFGLAPGKNDTLMSASPVYCYSSAGNYNVTLTAVSDSGCSATLEKAGMITIYPPPGAAFTWSPKPVSILSPTVQFTDLSTDASAIVYRLWNFGDGSDSASNSANPLHTYHDTGNYCATLIVMNNHGCTDTATNCLIVEPAFTLYIPSAFTPNGDGLNETFQPKGEYIKSFEMYIFDRWGMEIFHSMSINNGWNGAVNGAGQICQEDTYVYKITVTDSQGNMHSYIGNVNLLK